MRSRTLALLLVVASVVAVPVPRAAGADETCHGEAATIVGTPDSRITGTDHRDVIVTNGAAWVEAGRGSDLVCVTGDTEHVGINGERGDDEIDGTATTQGITVDGGPGSDVVTTDRGPDSVQVSRGGTDQISTGRGNDTVVGRSSEGWTADGGAGINSLVIHGGPASTGDNVWDVDVPHGTATLDGEEAFHFQGFTHFYPTVNRSDGDVLRFNGSAAGEEVLVGGLSRGEVDADLGGGDDSIGAIVLSRNEQVDLSGGPGADSVAFGGTGDGHLDADLATGRWDITRRAGTVENRVAGFEQLLFTGLASAVVRGSDRDEDITNGDTGCPTLFGGGGDDTLTVHGPIRTCGARLVGGPGDDRLSGRDTPDVLVGGPGTDRADGRQGRDRCAAETRIRCERR